MERDTVGDADGWRRVFQFIEARVKASGRTWRSIYPVTASQTKLTAMRDNGTPLSSDALRFKVCDGLGWSQDSIDRILAGGEPVVVGEIKRSTGKSSDDELRQEVADLRREIADIRRLLGEDPPSPLED